MFKANKNEAQENERMNPKHASPVACLVIDSYKVIRSLRDDVQILHMEAQNVQMVARS